MYKNHKGEIATFISIATLIGIAVFTFITSTINTNISQKQTTNTKAATVCDGTPVEECSSGSYNESRQACCNTSWQCIGAEWDPDFGYVCNEESNYPSLSGESCCGEIESCPSYPYYSCAESGYTYAEGQGCCRNVEDAPVVDPYEPEYQSPDNSAYNTCYSGTCIEGSCDGSEMDDVYGESCGLEEYSCCKNRKSAYTPGPEGSQDPESYLGQTEQPVQSDFACESTDLSCDTSGNGCDGSVEGYCHQSVWGICCRPYTVENPTENLQDQTTSVTTCADLGGECIYDGWGSMIDSNTYEKINGGECNWVYACYKQKSQQIGESDPSIVAEEVTPTPEEVSSTPEGQTTDDTPAKIKVGDEELSENQNEYIESLGFTASPSFDEGAEEQYGYNDENPGEVSVYVEQDGTYDFNCEDGVRLSIKTEEESEQIDENGNVIASGYNFDNVCQ